MITTTLTNVTGCWKDSVRSMNIWCLEQCLAHSKCSESRSWQYHFYFKDEKVIARFWNLPTWKIWTWVFFIPKSKFTPHLLPVCYMFSVLTSCFGLCSDCWAWDAEASSSLHPCWSPSLSKLRKVMEQDSLIETLFSTDTCWRAAVHEVPAMLQSLGLQRVGQDWVTELSWYLPVPYHSLCLVHMWINVAPQVVHW